MHAETLIWHNHPHSTEPLPLSHKESSTPMLGPMLHRKIFAQFIPRREIFVPHKFLTNFSLENREMWVIRTWRREREIERSNCCENYMKLTKNMMMRTAASLAQIIESRRAGDCWFGDRAFAFRVLIRKQRSRNPRSGRRLGPRGSQRFRWALEKDRTVSIQSRLALNAVSWMKSASKSGVNPDSSESSGAEYLIIKLFNIWSMILILFYILY